MFKLKSKVRLCVVKVAKSLNYKNRVDVKSSKKISEVIYVGC